MLKIFLISIRSSKVIKKKKQLQIVNFFQLATDNVTELFPFFLSQLKCRFLRSLLTNKYFQYSKLKQIYYLIHVYLINCDKILFRMFFNIILEIRIKTVNNVVNNELNYFFISSIITVT